jgi:hypothetical protein
VTAVRHSFLGGTICEVRTCREDDGAFTARVYVVQEGSLVLQRLTLNGCSSYQARTPSRAHALALTALRDRFGAESTKPAAVSPDSGFHVIEQSRTA